MLSPPWECKDHVRSYLCAASLWLLFCLPCRDRKILPLSPTVECSLSLVLCFVAQASRLLCLLFCCPSATSSHCETVTHYRSLLCSFVQLRSISENSVIYTESEKQPFETHHLGLFFLLLLSSLITVSPFFSVCLCAGTASSWPWATWSYVRSHESTCLTTACTLQISQGELHKQHRSRFDVLLVFN